MKLNIAGIEHHSSVNGPGVRYVLFTQGCPHHCRGCQNPETWNPSQGHFVEVDDLVTDILSTKYLDGLTLSGGDPLFQAEAILELVKKLKERNINIWCYTGWTYEEILSGIAPQKAKTVLSYLDVLVDGRFVLELKDEKCLYRGSSNQRLIDCQRSLAEQKVVLADTFDFGL